jgi:integrase
VIRFDAREARALKPGEHIVFAEAPGLRLQASETRRAWIYRYKSPVSGGMRQVKVGEWPAMSAAAAVVQWEQLRLQRDAGEDVAAVRREVRQAAVQRQLERRQERRAGTLTVRNVLMDYIEGDLRHRVKPKTYAEALRTANTMLAGFGERGAATFTRGDAFAAIDQFRGTPVQAAKLKQLLGAAWDRAIDAGRLSDEVPNWWRIILRGKLTSRGKRIAGEHIGAGKRTLTDDEVGDLLNWLPNFTALMQDSLELYLFTGARGAEILAMERHEIAEERDGLWWTVPREKLKMERSPLVVDLRVPLVGRAEQVVRRRMQRVAAGYLFPAGGKATGHTLQKTIQAIVYVHQPYSNTRPEYERPRLTVTHWAPHDLRRTVRTGLAAIGCPHEVAEAILGHVQQGVAGVYNRHSYDKERRQWLTKLAAHWERQAQRRRRSTETKSGA